MALRAMILGTCLLIGCYRHHEIDTESCPGPGPASPARACYVNASDSYIVAFHVSFEGRCLRSTVNLVDFGGEPVYETDPALDVDIGEVLSGALYANPCSDSSPPDETLHTDEVRGWLRMADHFRDEEAPISGSLEFTFDSIDGCPDEPLMLELDEVRVDFSPDCFRRE